MGLALTVSITALVSNYDPRLRRKYALCVARSVYTREYQLFLQHLRATRAASGLTLREVAQLLNRSHSYVAKCENGHNRVDVAQLYEFCRVFGVPFSKFAADLESLVEGERKPAQSKPAGKQSSD